MTRVFGVGSPEWNEANTPATKSLALTDFVGIAIHCAQGAALCDTPNAKPDDATTVPGSDNGFKALFGAKYVNPAITGGQPCVKATDGTNITDPRATAASPASTGRSRRTRSARSRRCRRTASRSRSRTSRTRTTTTRWAARRGRVRPTTRRS